ncbi:LAGLIDADG family homing endonuclease [Patescibacteria group bacterium]|nr:LAGLIDADG family homing endonuclease [Patescibacteria group bacterium]
MLSDEYVVGLTDGEGSFNVFLNTSLKNTQYCRVEFHYYLKLKEDDLSLLKKLKKHLNCGFIYFQKDKRVNHKNCYRYEVSSLRDIDNIIIPFFKKNRLISISRKKDFDLFCKIFKIVAGKKGKHISEEELRRIRKLKSEMHK